MKIVKILQQLLDGLNLKAWGHTFLTADQREKRKRKKKKKKKKEAHDFEKEERVFDFLGHHFATNRSANEELWHSIPFSSRE